MKKNKNTHQLLNKHTQNNSKHIWNHTHLQKSRSEPTRNINAKADRKQR